MARVAAAQVGDRAEGGEDETAEGDDRHRDVHVEDLLYDALVGVHRRPERGQRAKPVVRMMTVASESVRRRLP